MLSSLLFLLTIQGHRRYGREAVSQLEHALQCALLAESAGSAPQLITAALLHDLGHLVHPLGEDAMDQGLDDRHEYRAMPLLRPLFPSAVTEPIRLHVDAKRYLCAVDPRYWDSLSPVSQRTLELQGGPFSEAAAAAFIQQPHARDAVQLRLWDDRAKIPQTPTPPLDHFLPILIQCLNSSTCSSLHPPSTSQDVD